MINKLKTMVLKIDKLVNKLVLGTNRELRASQRMLRKRLDYTTTQCYLEVKE